MSDTPLTDDYVAEILSRDARRQNQSRFLANGVGSLLSRPRGSAPKPNTRFLRNIVRDADTHNAALRRKEKAESKVRLGELRRGRESRGERPRSESPDFGHERYRERKDERRSKRKSRRRERDLLQDQDGKRARPRSLRETSRHRHTQRVSNERVPYRGDAERDAGNSQHSQRDSDSDPLDSTIGPKPPPKVQARGRGATKDSAMDARFHPSYDPKTDMTLDPDELGDDWDLALEAVRDRAKWRKLGAGRLRAAGFTEDEVSHWEKGGGGGGGTRADGVNRDISDVRWSKQGESREWDRGKVIDGGRIDVKADWGRLKNS